MLNKSTFEKEYFKLRKGPLGKTTQIFDYSLLKQFMTISPKTALSSEFRFI